MPEDLDGELRRPAIAQHEPVDSTPPDTSLRGGLQAPITDEALVAGLAALGRALGHRHPGRRFIFETAPRDDPAGFVDGGEVVGRLTAPQDPHAALVDRDRLRAARSADVADEDAADHRP